MPEPSPLTLGLVPPQLRAMGPTKRRPLTPMQAVTMLDSITRWMQQRCPTLHLDVTKTNTSITIHAQAKASPHAG